MEPIYTYLHGIRRTEVFESGLVRLFVNDVVVEDHEFATLDEANAFASTLVEG